jgi:LysR family transcriptional regulator for bpeEF and oprC
VRVVESGSFSTVARERGVGQPAVSKQIAALEAHLGAQLMLRTSRSLTLTEAGQDFYESAVQLMGELDAAESRVGRRQASPSGLVRAIVAPVFGGLYVVPRLQEFFARYPDMVVELLISDRPVNLIEDGVDVAVHNGELSDSTLIARKIAATPIVTVATPAYLAKHGVPATPSELGRHACIIFVPRGGSRVSSVTSFISPEGISAPMMPNRSGPRSWRGLASRIPQAGSSRTRLPPVLCIAFYATMNRPTFRSA